MKLQLEKAEISPDEWLSVNQFTYDIRNVHGPCISVYYPIGKENETIKMLQETKRTKLLEKIETKIEEHIKKFSKKSNSVGKSSKTVCIFGWKGNDSFQIKKIIISKKMPFIYMEGKKPYIKPFSDILKTNYDVMLITLDQKSAKIQKFHGNQITQEAKLSINLHARHKKGGQSQGRFLRARQTKIHVFYKKIADKTRQMDAGTELILLGGNGQAKTEFFSELDSDQAKKCRFVENISFSTPLSKIYEKLIHHLYLHRKKHVAEIISKYENLVKTGLTAKRNSVIYKALQKGAVDVLIVSAEYHASNQFKKIIKMLETAKKTSAEIEFATSPKIIKKLDMDDAVLAILRYRVQ